MKPFWLPEVLKHQNQKIIIVHFSVLTLTLPCLATLKGQVPIET
jgi:hypothetical protein